MNNGSDILERINNVLADPATPPWGRVLLLCLRDDHRILHEHIRNHDRAVAAVNKVLISIIIAISISFAAWLLGGRFPWAGW